MCALQQKTHAGCLLYILGSLSPSIYIKLIYYWHHHYQVRLLVSFNNNNNNNTPQFIKCHWVAQQVASQQHFLSFKHLMQSCENKAPTSSETMLKLPKDPQKSVSGDPSAQFEYTHPYIHTHTLSIGDNTLAAHKQVCCASGLYFLVVKKHMRCGRRSRKWETLCIGHSVRNPLKSQNILTRTWKMPESRDFRIGKCRLNVQNLFKYYQKWWWLFFFPIYYERLLSHSTH